MQAPGAKGRVTTGIKTEQSSVQKNIENVQNENPKDDQPKIKTEEDVPSQKAINLNPEELRTAIIAMIDDISTLIKAQSRESRMYSRLIRGAKLDTNTVAGIVRGFTVFFNAHDKKYGTIILDDDLNMNDIPEETVISYGTDPMPKIYYCLGWYLKKLTPVNKRMVARHLVKIWSLIDPSEEKFQCLKNPVESPEKKFVANLVTGVATTVGDVEKLEEDDTEKAISAMMTIMPDMMRGIDKGVKGGSLDPAALLTQLQGALFDATSRKPNPQATPQELADQLHFADPKNNPRLNVDVKKRRGKPKVNVTAESK